MIRLFDIALSSLGLLLFSPLLTFLSIIGVIDTGSPFFRQKRVGRHLKHFTLIKFRTMKQGTPSVATHLANSASVTPFGKFLRTTKLDELPQLFNVLKGDMSLVGPRPCLPVQEELIEARMKLGVYEVRPGITGLAQIEGVDMSTPNKLADIDLKMITSSSLRQYLFCILQTVFGKGRGDRLRK